jgi:hypothetical protein
LGEMDISIVKGPTITIVNFVRRIVRSHCPS